MVRRRGREKERHVKKRHDRRASRAELTKIEMIENNLDKLIKLIYNRREQEKIVQ